MTAPDGAQDRVGATALRLLSPNVSRDGVIDVPVVLGHLRSEPIKYALLSPDEALKLATELIQAVRRA